MKIETKCDVGQKIYFVFGDPKKNIIVFSGIITKISIFAKGRVMYHFNEVKLEVDKNNMVKDNSFVQIGFFYEENLDSFYHPRGMSCWPTFTSKKMCIEYLRRVTKNG